MAAKKKMSRMERDSLVEQMDRDLEEFILQKIEANKDKPREPFDFKKIEEVCLVYFLGLQLFCSNNQTHQLFLLSRFPR